MKIYDASNTGLNHIHDKISIVYQASLVTNGEIDESKIKASCEPLNGKRICLDVECWRWDYFPWNEDGIKASLDRYIELVRLARLAAPDSDIGLFIGRIHVRGLIRHDDGMWGAFQKLTVELAPLMDMVDTIYPSAYAIYDRPDFWAFQFSAFLSELLKYEKLIIPFVWHRGAGSIYDGEELGTAFWRYQLGFLEALTISRTPIHTPFIGGIAVWTLGDEDKPEGHAPWWVELQRFMAISSIR